MILMRPTTYRSLDVVLENMRQQQYLVALDIQKYMKEYDVRSYTHMWIHNVIRYEQETGTAESIGRMLFRLVEWYRAWSPIPE